MPRFKPPRSIRRQFSPHRPGPREIFPAAPGEEGEDGDGARHEPMSPSRRRKLRGEMDKAEEHFFGTGREAVG